MNVSISHHLCCSDANVFLHTVGKLSTSGACQSVEERRYIDVTMLSYPCWLFCSRHVLVFFSRLQTCDIHILSELLVHFPKQLSTTPVQLQPLLSSICLAQLIHDDVVHSHTSHLVVPSSRMSNGQPLILEHTAAIILRNTSSSASVIFNYRFYHLCLTCLLDPETPL